VHPTGTIERIVAEMPLEPLFGIVDVRLRNAFADQVPLQEVLQAEKDGILPSSAAGLQVRVNRLGSVWILLEV